MSKSSTQKTDNAPPKWAEPLLKEGAQAALDLYHSGQGYTPYTGQTRAGFSAPTLGGMNNALAATGYTGPAISNDTVQQNPAVQNAKDMIAKLLADRAAKANARAVPVAPVVPEKKKEQVERGGNGSSSGRSADGSGGRGGWGGH